MKRGPLLALVMLGACVAGCAARDETRPTAREWDPDSIPDAYAKPSGALMWPGATRGFQVTETGDLYGGVWRVKFAPAVDGVPAGSPARIAALERWRPVLRWTRHCGEVRFDFEAVAFPRGSSNEDTALVVSLEVRARNTGGTAHSMSLGITLAPPGHDPVFAAWDAPDSAAEPRWAWPGAKDTACAWSDQQVGGTGVAIQASLAPHATRVMRYLLPAYPEAAAKLSRLAQVPHARRVDDVLARWDAWLAQGTAFQLNDAETEAALKAANIVLLSCRERHGPHWFPIGGPFQYRDFWLRDGARLTYALAIAGHTTEACSLAAGIASLQWPNGSFLTQRGQLDGTGQALWTFEQVLLRSTPRPRLESYVEEGVRAWRWLEWQRSPELRGSEKYGAMMPFADPRDGELVRAQLVGDDAWSIAGERAVAHLLHAAGNTALAESAFTSERRYRVDFVAALDRCGAKDVPPSWQRIGHDWGNLAAGWPCAALPTDDSRLAATARRVWAFAGGAGPACYGARDSLHGYVGADLGTWALLAGRRAQADSVLAALLHWRTACGTAGELFTRGGDFGRNLPPHPTSAAALVTLARNAVLYDDEDTLRLTLGARTAWWRGAHIERAPTWWGKLDVTFGRAGDWASWKWTPVPVWTTLTLPPGTRVAEAPAAPLKMGGRSDVVLAPPGTREARVRVVDAGRHGLAKSTISPSRVP